MVSRIIKKKYRSSENASLEVTAVAVIVKKEILRQQKWHSMRKTSARKSSKKKIVATDDTYKVPFYFTRCKTKLNVCYCFVVFFTDEDIDK